MIDGAGPHEGIYEEIDHIRAKLAGITDRHRERLVDATLRLDGIEALLQHLQARINRLEDWRANETQEAS